ANSSTGSQPGVCAQPFRPPEAGQPLQIVWHKIQTALTSPRPMAANSSTGSQPGVCAQPFRPPEAGQPLQIVWHKI
ncbi:hypothetical protein NLB25_27760, partial [Klebsiella pneumoniae]|nr:hypothetical protein [Klebsiella pneumoniae]